MFLDRTIAKPQQHIQKNKYCQVKFTVALIQLCTKSCCDVTQHAAMLTQHHTALKIDHIQNFDVLAQWCIMCDNSTACYIYGQHENLEKVCTTVNAWYEFYLNVLIVVCCKLR